MKRAGLRTGPFCLVSANLIGPDPRYHGDPTTHTAFADGRRMGNFQAMMNIFGARSIAGVRRGKAMIVVGLSRLFRNDRG